MRKVQKIWLFLLIAAVAVAGVFLARVYLGATSPSSVKLIVYKLEFMTGASDTDPQVVFSNATGQEIDLTKDIAAVIGQVQIPAGTYKRIRMTVTNEVKLSITNAADNPCGADTIFTDRVFPIAGYGTNLNSKVQISFATYDDGGGAWAGSQITHFLLRPVTVDENQAEQVKFRFNTADTLFCSSGTVEMRAPWSVWAGTLDNATN